MVAINIDLLLPVYNGIDLLCVLNNVYVEPHILINQHYFSLAVKGWISFYTSI